MSNYTTFHATMAPSLTGPVRKNTISNAVATPTESGVLACPNSRAGRSLSMASPLVYGQGGPFREAGRVTLLTFLTPCPPNARKNANGGFFTRNGEKAMTTKTQQTPAYTPPKRFSFIQQANSGPRLNLQPRRYDIGNLDGHIASREVCERVKQDAQDHAAGRGSSYIATWGLRDALIAAVHALDDDGELGHRGAAVTLLDDLTALMHFGIRQAMAVEFCNEQLAKGLNYFWQRYEQEEKDKAAFIARMTAARIAKRQAKQATEVAA